MKTKQRMRLEIKELSAEGAFEGLLSPYGNVDLGGDIVEKGAYTKNLSDHGNTRPLLWQHKSDSPIGSLMLEDRPEGLWCKGQLLMDLPDAKKAYLLIKAKIVKGLSIGFESVKDSVENGVRHLKEIRLWEGSIVTFAMNEMAQILQVKAHEHKAGDPEDMCQALCRICSSTCESAIYYCYDAGGDMANMEHISMLADCIYCCDFCCSAMNRESASEAEICALCEVVCRRAATACASMAGDAVMMACADACTACADCCAVMAKEPPDPMEEMAHGAHEHKEGRRFSSASMDTMKSAHAHVKSAGDILTTLLDAEAGDAATSEKAVVPKTEPVDHSALSNKIDEMRGLLAWNH
jgi:HK97 family phage prohead protease